MNMNISATKEAETHLLEAAKEFQKCMQCGKCRSVCPVFREMGNELYVARGKNKLAEKLVSGELEITDRLEDASPDEIRNVLSVYRDEIDLLSVRNSGSLEKLMLSVSEFGAL